MAAQKSDAERRVIAEAAAIQMLFAPSSKSSSEKHTAGSVHEFGSSLKVSSTISRYLIFHALTGATSKSKIWK